MSIGVFIIATGKYIQYTYNLVKSIRQYFLTKHSLTIYLFTDSSEAPDGTMKIYQEKEEWPRPTLCRYHYISKACLEHKIKHDYYYYFDADISIVADIGDEVLGKLVVVQHPGFYRLPKEKLYYEKNFLSHAYVNPNKIEKYYAGGFNGGSEYLKMATQIVGWADKDLEHNFIPKYHDETYLNRYCTENKPDVILSPAYCYPDLHKDAKRWELSEIPPKILAITKPKNFKSDTIS